MDTTTRDYVDETGDPLECSDCGRPTYYDTADETYHHDTEPERGCFLIPPEPSPPARDDVHAEIRASLSQLAGTIAALRHATNLLEAELGPEAEDVWVLTSALRKLGEVQVAVGFRFARPARNPARAQPERGDITPPTP